MQLVSNTPISFFFLALRPGFFTPVSKLVHAQLLQSYPTVHGILQARTLEWVVITSSRGSSQPRDWTCVSCIAGRFFTAELLGKPEPVHILQIFLLEVVFTFHNTWNYFNCWEMGWFLQWIISKERLSESSEIAATVDSELAGQPRRTQGGKKTCHGAAIGLQPREPWGNRMWTTAHWPQTGEACNTHMSSVSPDSCIFPSTEKHYIP